MRFTLIVLTLAASSALAAKEAPSGPLSPKERRIYDGASCETFRNMLADARKGTEAGRIDATVNGLTRPDAESPSQWQQCMAMAIRDDAAYRARQVESEAVKLLQTFGEAMAGVYEKTGKLCGSTSAAPVSVTFMAKGDYGVKEGDWDKTWDCVGAPMLNAQRFQYQITVDQKKRSFTITARGYPEIGGKLRTLTRTGKVSGNAVQLAEIQRK